MIKDVRFQPLTNELSVLQITCECGNIVRTHESGHESLDWSVTVRRNNPSILYTLICECGERFIIRTQSNHFHVSAIQEKSEADPDRKNS